MNMCLKEHVSKLQGLGFRVALAGAGSLGRLLCSITCTGEHVSGLVPSRARSFFRLHKTESGIVLNRKDSTTSERVIRMR